MDHPTDDDLENFPTPEEFLAARYHPRLEEYTNHLDQMIIENRKRMEDLSKYRKHLTNMWARLDTVKSVPDPRDLIQDETKRLNDWLKRRANN